MTEIDPLLLSCTATGDALMISLLSYKDTLHCFIPATLMHSLWSHPNLISEREITKRYAVNQKLKWRCTPQSTVGESDRLAWPVFVLCVDVVSRWDKMDGEVKWATQRAERCMAAHMEWDGMTDEQITGHTGALLVTVERGAGTAKQDSPSWPPVCYKPD